MKYSLLVAAFFVVHLSFARQNPDLASPYTTLRLFEEKTSQERYRPIQAVDVFYLPGADLEESLQAVIALDNLLKGAGILLLKNDVPKEHDYFNEEKQDSTYIISPNYPDIFLTRVDGNWQFHLNEIEAIRRAHNEMFRFGTEFFEDESVRETYFGVIVFGLQLWQWLGILLFLTVGIILRYLISLFFKRLMMKLIAGLGKEELGHKYLLPVSRPIGMLVVLALVAVFYPILRLPGLTGYYLVLGLKGLIPLFGMIVLYRAVDILGVAMLKLATKTESTLDDQLVPLLKKVLKVLVVLVGGLVVMDSLNVPILPLLTGLSIGGLAFALAAQDTIKNFFGSLMIFIDKPFQIGDWISSSEIDGTVEEVGFRSTRIRTFRNSVVYVPNGKLADSVVDNHGLRQFRRFKTMIALKYDTPPERIEVFVEGLKRLVLRHPKTNKENHQIYLNDMGASSLDILFYIFFEAPTWSDELKFRQELILEILKLGNALSVHFAFPTQTVHVENLPGQDSLSPNYTWTKADVEQKLNDFLNETA